MAQSGTQAHGDGVDTAHRAREPAVIELQGPAQVGALPAVDMVPSPARVDSSQMA